MGEDAERALTIGVASSALFDLAESDEVFREQGQEAYEAYQAEHLHDQLKPGIAFPFVKRLLSLNDLTPGLVEVIIMSRNSPTSGLRVMESIGGHRLAITRAVFRTGRSSTEFMDVFGMTLFLSANADDVKEAVRNGSPAGQVLRSSGRDDDDEDSLRIAFDFDGVLADDSSEKFFKNNPDDYAEYERKHANEPLSKGPLENFLAGVNRIQKLEDSRVEKDINYVRRVRVSLVTARNAPAHERAVRSLQEWGVKVDDAFFLGGLDKTDVLNQLRPHMFFDDQLKNLESAELTAPAVHIPFGIRNNWEEEEGYTSGKGTVARGGRVLNSLMGRLRKISSG
ncbi:5'-nucleotidase [uncultured Propionibacterium sp.]|uniref:5'-nucleotidase n=1 Tax=uncultured Propionibacterium sp. TaxID=218066 RepID=UPI002931B12F|nr:5'-nucleotidase [uncultured Propionibacterium sp.]